MFVPFTSLPPTSRIWIFQSNRPMTGEEVKLAESTLQQFTETWAAHGSPLKTSFAIKHGQFIVLAADETHESPSGCSIDSSVRVLKGLEQSLSIQLFDRSLLAFQNGGQITLIALQDLKEKFKQGILNERTLTFNNLIATKGELETHWLVPAGSTWLKRYMSNELAKVK